MTKKRLNFLEPLQREKYWSELDSTERVERLRCLVKQQKTIIEHLRSMVDSLMRHQHNTLGQLLKPLREYDGLTQMESGARDEKDDNTYI